MNDGAGNPPRGGGFGGQPPAGGGFGGQPPAGGGGFGQPPAGGGFAGQPPQGGGFGGQPPGFGAPPPQGGGFGGPPPQGGGFGGPPQGFGPPAGFGGQGAPPPSDSQGGGGSAGTEPLAIVSVAFGALGILTCCCTFWAAPLPLVAVITGGLALKKANDEPNNESAQKGKTLAIIGLCLGGGMLLIDAVVVARNILGLGGNMLQNFNR